MSHSAEFFQSIIDSLTEHIVVVDQFGAILFVNAAWTNFGADNACSLNDWPSANYLDVCNASAASGDRDAALAFAGIRKLMANAIGFFSLEYPCHSATDTRWFTMTVTPLEWNGAPRYVISHQNITDRKLAEQKVLSLSLTDSLTALANRRHFDSFLRDEWLRATRTNTTVSMILIDIDQFKLYNDGYGHQAGDDCLSDVGSVIGSFAKRPSDIAARYGGEEFAVILGNTGAEASAEIADALLNAIRNLNITHAYSSVDTKVTVSIGVASMVPRKHLSGDAIVEAADRALYDAKEAGRNRVCINGKHTQTRRSPDDDS